MIDPSHSLNAIYLVLQTGLTTHVHDGLEAVASGTDGSSVAARARVLDGVVFSLLDLVPIVHGKPVESAAQELGTLVRSRIRTFCSFN